MKKGLSIVLAVVLAFSFFIFNVMLGVMLFLNSDTYFMNHFEKNNVSENTKVSLEDLKTVNDEVQNYLNAKRSDLVIYAERDGEQSLIFNENEQSHMADVKKLYEGFKVAFFVCAAVNIVALFYAFKKKSVVFLSAIKYGSVGAVVIPIVFVMFFDKMFTFFHEIFFSAGNWMFDPASNIIVNLYTESFFMGFCTRLMLLNLFLCAALFVSASMYKKKIAKVQ